MLINLSDFLQSYWIIIIIFIIGLIIGIRFFIQQPKGQRLWDTLKLSFPVLRDLNIKIAAATLGRTMSSLLQSGVPLIISLAIVKNILNNVLLADVMDLATEELEKGKSLSSVLRGNKYFTPMLVQMIAVGEQSGSLDVVLERLAEVGEQQQALRSRIAAALIYPIFMAVVGIGVLFLLITFIVPSITKVFTDRDQALPLPTTILISLSDFLQSYWIILVFIIVGIVIGLRFFIQQPKGQRAWDTLKLSIPVLSDLNIKIAAATLGRTMSSLLQSGVPLITSLEIVKNILNNVLLADIMDLASEELKKGKSLSGVLRGNKYFTPMLVQMIAVGEQSGSLEKMLEKAADSYEKEVEIKIMAMTSMIEPIMILVMGLAVSFIVISILLPIFEMNQLIK
jgi:general secretion pathway protein F